MFEFDFEDDLRRVENFENLEEKVIFLKSKLKEYEEACEIITRTDDYIYSPKNYHNLIKATINYLKTNKLKKNNKN